MTAQISPGVRHGNVAESYDRYFVPAIAAPLAADLVDATVLRPGERVLDIACGTGVVTRLAAARVGSQGTIAGVDVNPAMLAVARAMSQGLTPPIAWYESGAEALPFGDGAFDVAFCQLGLQLFADRPAALGEARRVLVPGGRLVLNVPGPMPPIFAAVESALARHVAPEAAAFVQAVFSLDDPHEVAGLLTEAGFVDVDAHATVKTLTLPAPREFLWQYVASTPLAGPVGALDDERRAAIEHDVVSSCQQFVVDGSLVLRQPLTVATARR